MSEFIIVFREVLEAALVVGIIYLLLEKTNQKSHLPKLWFAVFLSIVASITRYPTAILAAIAAPTPSQSFTKWSFRLDFSKRR